MSNYIPQKSQKAADKPQKRKQRLFCANLRKSADKVSNYIPQKSQKLADKPQKETSDYSALICESLRETKCV